MASFPSWIELSGLPDHLRVTSGGPFAWLMLRTLIDIDCALNTIPANIDIPIFDLANRTGLNFDEARETLLWLQTKKFICAFIPDATETEEESGLYKIRTPIRTPMSHGLVIRAQQSQPTPRNYLEHRYCPCAEVPEPDTADMQRAVDNYLNTCGFKVNAFIVDELAMLAKAVPADKVDAAFERALRTGIRDFTTIKRWAYASRKKQDVEP